MRSLSALFTVLVAAGLAWAQAQPAAPATQTLKLADWCTVTCPTAFRIGTVAHITVAYHGIAEKTKLCCDLHYNKTDGSYGGFFSNDWHGAPDIQGDGRHTFAIPIHEQVGIGSVTILVFTDPTGAWATHTRLVRSSPVPVNDPDPGYAKWLARMKYNKSWIAFDWTPLQGRLVEGEKIRLTIRYYLDPSENYETTTLHLAALGPRIPKPNAPRPVSFANTQHIWYGEQSAQIQPGRGSHTFELTIPKALWQNWLLLLASFHDSRGKQFPWDVRAEAYYHRRGGHFELETGHPGNLFTYDEPVRIIVRLKNVGGPGQMKTLRYQVFDATKTQVIKGKVPFVTDHDGQTLTVQLRPLRRGTFLFRASVDGWETRETTFCTIPDLAGITAGRPTRFGMTVHDAPWLGARAEDVLQIARKLGLTTCRAFTEWVNLEPGPNEYAFPFWDGFFDAAKRNHISTVVTIYDPPAWVLPRGQYIGYNAFDCDLNAWRDMVRRVSQHYKGKIWGWEWLNEITPGGAPDYISQYVKMCRIGTETARSVDPDLHFLLAGGLWPRGFRLDVLNAGVGKYVDVLPVHYSDGSGVAEARADLDSFGFPKTAVWDDESASEMILWNQPGLDIVGDTTQSSWVLRRWVDELSAGCSRIIYFGGEGSPIADWDYLLADHSPRPVAATLAVLVSKLFGAKPLGVFCSPGQSSAFYVFDRQGKAVIVASTGQRGGETVKLAVGARPIVATDYQGNESEIPEAKGVATVQLKPMPCFLEGADLDTVKAYLVPAIQVPSAVAGREQPGVVPQVTVLRGAPGSVPVRLRNPYTRRLTGSLALEGAASWLHVGATKFSLNAGETKVVPLAVSIPATQPAVPLEAKLTCRYSWDKLPVVTKPLTVSVISRESVGNLLANGGFEEADAHGAPTGWHGTNAKLFSAKGLGLGLGQHVLRFENAPTWAHFGQQIPLRGGMTYLYTMWVWNHGMEGGSNINQVMQDGSERDLYDQQVINIGNQTPGWQVFTCRYQAPPNLKTAAFVPVVKGNGWAMYDNVRVTAFEGSDFAAEAWKAAAPPVMDGTLRGWNQACPIPLLGQNQLHVLAPNYKWSPANLSGVAYLAWDAKNLYVTVQVRDDVNHPGGNGESVIDGDSVILAFDPTNRGPDAAARSVEYYLSAMRPGSGSGKYTLWRTRAHNGGRPAGHVARDSSVYDVEITPQKGGCVYQVRIPFSELGVTPAFGGKLGFSIQLNDNDGSGPAAQMNWGGGLFPAWSPASFGIVTFVE